MEELGMKMEDAATSTLESDYLNFAENEVFQSIRDAFTALGFNESNIRSHYIFTGISESFTLPRFAERKTTAISGLDALTHLFMGQDSIPVDCAIASFGSQLFSDLQEVKLLQIEDNGTLCRATVRIEPVDDLLVCADRIPDKPPVRPDLVYHPWDYSAQLYTRIIPPTKCTSFLEMCCGSAYVGLKAARSFAESVHGVDINPRAIQFAEFNKKLNGIENVQTYCGDLFKPVQTMRFDRIVAHPPYIPALVDSVAYKDGGVDGERISTDLIRGLPSHLEDGGAFFGWLSLSDRLDAPAELRVRNLLGTYDHELDVALLVVNEQSPGSFLLKRAGPNPFSKENEQLKEECRKLGITRFLTTILTIRSRKGPSPLTVRHRATGWETVMAMAEHN
jgi:methylase of polypeptide subunit release factors